MLIKFHSPRALNYGATQQMCARNGMMQAGTKQELIGNQVGEGTDQEECK